MAHPKRKISTQRSAKRRTHHKVESVQLAACSNCGSTVIYHRVCPECGYYKGKLAIDKGATA
ncbi:MAG: 50S ribosomal protein L32 [Bacteroidales bacterium]|nr:50S ribosomal protein L32 [Bacteroidales bacterium]